MRSFEPVSIALDLNLDLLLEETRVTFTGGGWGWEGQEEGGAEVRSTSLLAFVWRMEGGWVGCVIFFSLFLILLAISC